MADRGPQLSYVPRSTPGVQTTWRAYPGLGFGAMKAQVASAVRGSGQIWPRPVQIEQNAPIRTAVYGEQGVLALSSRFAVLSVEYPAAARLRVYQTAAARTADLARSVYTAPVANSGILYEYVAVGAEVDEIPWVGWLASGEAQLYYQVDGGSGVITLNWKGI